MTMLRRTLTALVAGAALAAVPLLPSAAHAAAAPRPASGCDFELVSVYARNLHNDGRSDEVALRLDRTWFPTSGWVTFRLGDEHDAGDFGDPTMGFGDAGLPVRLSINGWPVNHPIDRTIPCAPVTNETRTFSNGDAIYDVTYNVT